MPNRPLKVYLADPEVFLSNAAEVLANKRKVCKAAGWIGLSPVDNEIPHDRAHDRQSGR